jgi:hypothetical protein
MTESDTDAPVVISGWELYAVIFEIIFFGALVMALLWVVGPSLAPIQLPSYIWSAAGFCALGLLLIPGQRILARTRPGIQIRVRDAIAGVFIGSALYAIAMRFLL